jgi:alkylated DNA repair protein (DNA oxidative demethylase)
MSNSSHTRDFFEIANSATPKEELTSGAWLLRGFALDSVKSLLAEIEQVRVSAPLRHQVTPGGFRMSVAMTNCGPWGWVSDRTGYRYESRDPLSGQPWPSMPAAFSALARSAAHVAGFPHFNPDACLINCYQPGARLTLHQDKDECDFSEPIVSVSLGLPAVFLFGGNTRPEPRRRIPLEHGDVLVWGGRARLRHHGVLPLKDGYHPILGSQRVNLTFRRAH